MHKMKGSSHAGMHLPCLFTTKYSFSVVKEWSTAVGEELRELDNAQDKKLSFQAGMHLPFLSKKAKIQRSEGVAPCCW